MRVLITRAHDDAALLAEVLDRAGIESIIDPLLDIATVPGPRLDLSGVQGLLMTSANGVRAFCQRSDNRTVAVYAVGDASAREATRLGFTDVHSASGDVDALAELIKQKVDPNSGTLLHGAGSKVAGDLAGALRANGFSYVREVLYEVNKADRLSPQTIADFEAGLIDGVLLYSPRTATLFSDLARLAEIDNVLASVTAYCLSPNVAEKSASLAWKRLAVAAQPDQTTLVMLLIKDMSTQ